MSDARDVVVFGGPSLPADARSRWPSALLMPPAKAGDILALLNNPPRTIVVIDGSFDSCASVWHKELLLLAAAGTSLFGASSIGALRAAELHGLGMTGVGTIYQAYRRGLLVGDDEVALLHAPAELGWRALTIPMVQVRAALRIGLRRRLWSMDQARDIRDEIHDIHFSERDAAALSRLLALRHHGFAPLQSLIGDPLSAVKQHDAVRCIDIAMTTPAARPAVASPPLTCFVRNLAKQVGVRLPVAEGQLRLTP